MSFFHSRLYVGHPHSSHVPDALSWPLSSGGLFALPNYHQFVVKNAFPSYSFRCSLSLQPVRALQTSLGAGESSQEYSNGEGYKEEQRRRKIGLENKGRVPWNTGWKHSAETRLRIKQKTIEALNDPKVRKKMSEHPRTHRLAKAKLHLEEMSISTDFEDLHDGFEGSQDECSNFTEVFVGNDTGSTGKRCLVGAVDFKNSKNTEASHCSNSANSAVTSRSCSKKLCQEDTNTTHESCGWVSALGSFPERFAVAEREDQNVSFKRMKFSTGKVSRGEAQKKKASSAPLQQKEIVSGLPSTPTNSVCQRVALHLVESSSVEMDRNAEMEEIDVTKSRIQDSDASERREVVVGKAIASPSLRRVLHQSLLFQVQKLL